MKKKGMAQVQETAGTAYSMTDEIPKDLLADQTERPKALKGKAFPICRCAGDG